MRQIFILFISIFFSLSLSGSEITKIKMYFVKWDSRYVVPVTQQNIKKRYECFAEISGSDFNLMFDNATDCKSKLGSREKLEKGYDAFAHILVEFYFGRKVVKVYFLGNGEYCFEGNWYKMHPVMTYLLFHNFSNILFDEKAYKLAVSQLGNSNRFW